MAAVVQTILNRRKDIWQPRRYDDEQAPAPGGSKRAHAASMTKKTHDAYAHLSRDELRKLEQAATKVQSWFRGVRTRVLFTRMVGFSSDLTSRAVNESLYRMMRTHNRVQQCMFHFVLLVFFIATIVVQSKVPKPDSSDVNLSIQHVIGLADVNPRTDVTRSQQVFDYIESVIPVLAKAMHPASAKSLNFSDLPMSEHCSNISHVLCNSHYKKLNMSNEHELLREMSICLDSTTQRDDGYIDNQNRVLFAIYVTQSRYEITPCRDSVKTKNPMRLLPGHSCLNDNAPPTKVYESDVCGTMENPTSADCFDFREFIYNPALSTFVTLLGVGHMGEGWGYEYTKCRLKNLRHLGWLDYRTRESCVYMFTFNQNGQGRLAALRDCFSFSIGGEVTLTRDLASSSFPPDSSEVVGLTSFFAVLVVLFGLYESWTTYLRAFYKRPLLNPLRHPDDGRGRFTCLRAKNFKLTCEDFFTWLLFCLCVSSLVVFFQLSEDTEDHFFETTGNLTQLADSSQFWTSMVHFINVVADWQHYYALLAGTMFVFVMRLVIVLDFHPSLAIVTGTLRIASKQLVSFLFVYVIVLLSYACLGMLFFGQNYLHFNSFQHAIVTLVFTSLSDLELVGSIVINPTNRIGTFGNTYWIQVIWYYSFVVIVAILLFNVLLSIIVSAFVDFRERRKDQDHYLDLFTTMKVSCNIWYRRLRGCARSLRGSKERTVPPTVLKSIDLVTPFDQPFDLDPFHVIASLDRLRRRYSNRPVNAKVLRQELNSLLDSTVCERVIAQIRRDSVRNRHVSDSLQMDALYFNDHFYRAHMFVLSHKLYNVTVQNPPHLVQTVHRDGVPSKESLNSTMVDE